MVTADVSARLAWPDDASAIATVQVAAWRADYADVLGADVVSSLDVDAVAAQWAASLTAPPDARMRVLVALERATVRGFAVVHPNADPDADPVADGEIGELVVDPEHRSAGHGSRLLQAAIDTLAADSFTRARWWMPADNDGLRTFATSAGWGPDGAHRSVEDEAGTVVKQVRLHTALTA
ncbi:GNAT family N-acetyltransferase [Aeromicrobium terrae]|uniref:GNAT family N-acetyltransferase n=1 Tax=Aeromicrobium terrae TaxID=2498846 RepID=A0A5C8NNF7_9ACTN|nr:GNAT family N-acetyltransferase [Aeromicrobium terrae]TXL63289.1 GNAT family N-acetyltransferase [Aeromicrobium terrae]